MQKEEVLKMVVALKVKKINVSAIEKDLQFSNGLIGKAAKGTLELSEERFEKFENYFNQKMGVQKPINGTKMVVTKNEGLRTVPSDEKIQRLNETVAQINKDYGAGTLMYFGDKPNQEYEVISTGSLGLDIALGIGGLPRGRMVEIFGLESSGKTTIALEVIANAQKGGLKCLYIDAENSFDPEYATNLGINIDNIQYCQPSCGEDALEVADRAIQTGAIGVVVIDSVAALVPKAELEGQMGDSKMGLHARLMSQACRKLVSVVAKTNTLLIFINQIRNKIGVMYGSPEVVTGGMALQFYASVRLRVTRSTTEQNSVKNGDEIEGNLTTVKVIKNKCCPPFKSAKFDIIYGHGIDKEGELIDVAIEQKVIDKIGSWLSYNGTKIGQGKKQSIELLRDNEEMKSEIIEKLKSKNK